jgi:hypothetical protein
MYIDERTKVDGEFLTLRRLVMEKKKPRRVFVQVRMCLDEVEISIAIDVRILSSACFNLSDFSFF